MIDFSIICKQSTDQLDDIYKNCHKELEKVDEIIAPLDNIYLHTNHPFNFLLPFLYGGITCTLSSAKAVNDFLKKVHDEYSHKDGWIGTLLDHSGDYMDKMPRDDATAVFLTRQGTNSNIGMHRLFWGHDIFSISGDNPFVLLSNQYGIIRGILKAFRHLVVDTFSAQGLPVPFHSWFDYTVKNGDKLDVKNALLDFAKKMQLRQKVQMLRP